MTFYINLNFILYFSYRADHVLPQTWRQYQTNLREEEEGDLALVVVALVVHLVAEGENLVR